MKTSDLTGAALDWAVAKCEGLMQGQIAIDGVTHGFYKPSTDWAQGGPIIEREGIALWQSATPDKGKWCAADARWMDLDPESEEFIAMPDPWHGPTPLIAAMRCYVASKLGDDVTLPPELEQTA